MRWGAVALGVWVAVGGAAWGHPLAPSLLDIREQSPGEIHVAWKRPLAASGPRLRPVLPASCTASAPSTEHTDDIARTIESSATCPPGLVGTRFGVEGLTAASPPVLLRIAPAAGPALHHVLRAGDDVFVVPAAPGGAQVAGSYVRLGLEHIANGYDHLLFLLGLVALAATNRRLAAMVTAFTAGHGLTLSLAALGRIAVPSAPIEALIALTILILAHELTRPPAPRPSLLQRHPATLTFGFGLLHGLGFASALREAGLPQHEIVLALLGFNAGIELGQLGFVLAISGATGVLARPLAAWPGRRMALAYAIGAVAACLVLERTVVLL